MENECRIALLIEARLQRDVQDVLAVERGGASNGASGRGLPLTDITENAVQLFPPEAAERIIDHANASRNE